MTDEERKAILDSIVVSSASRSFLSEMCVRDLVARTSHSELYEEYQKWCIAIGKVCTISSKMFARNLHTKTTWVEKKRGAGGRIFWHGIRLKTAPDPSNM
jgi:phage/plasmid-associated DNA primase